MPHASTPTSNTGGLDTSEDAVVETVFNGLGNVTELKALERDADGSQADGGHRLEFPPPPAPEPTRRSMMRG